MTVDWSELRDDKYKSLIRGCVAHLFGRETCDEFDSDCVICVGWLCTEYLTTDMTPDEFKKKINTTSLKDEYLEDLEDTG